MTPHAACLAFAAALWVLVALGTSGQTTPAGHTGVGAQVGSRSGLTVKHYLSAERALALLGTWDRGAYAEMNGYYLWEGRLPSSPLRYLVGPGLLAGALTEDGDPRLLIGAQARAGFTFFVERFEVFLVAEPQLRLHPRRTADLDAAVGLRYYW